MKLRLILGDQLNTNNSWYKQVDDNVMYFMAEMRQETDYVAHHIQKVVAFFQSMREFAAWLKTQGHTVIYYPLDAKENQQDLTHNLQQLISQKNISKFEYQLPDEYRLDQQLNVFCNEISILSEAVDTQHFYTTRQELSNFFHGRKQVIMEYFYRYMRKKHDILMVNAKDPEGGKWNFDHSNRKKWKGTPAVPVEKYFRKDVSSLVALLKQQGITTIGNIDANNFQWPTNRLESLSLLDYFCKNLLKHFGDYQDAMDPNEYYLFHSTLSFAMNSKMLAPQEVIDTVINYWQQIKDEIDIAQVEGFVRQILGWREYMRGLYWREMPKYQNLNRLENYNKLPNFYWTANTKMNCLHHAIKQSLDTAYAHHIQRLMITGNYALLTQTHPDEVDQWYLGIYIDAIEWVEITNTRGMSQFADGGIVATKPYVSSGSYIKKMSNYCRSCHYKVSEKTGEKACPFNSLYWNFLDDKKAYFKNNQRISMMLNLLNKMNKETLIAHKERAQDIIENPNKY